MKNKKQKAHMNIPMCVACVLLCLTMFSFHLCGGLYAKYTASGSGEDSARVAKFDVSKNGACFSNSFVVETVPGDTIREFIVENKSEVAVAYTVTIKNTTKNVPYRFSVNGSAPSEGECSVANYLAPNTDSNTIKIVASWDNTDALQYMGMKDLIELTITAEQVD